MNMTEDNYVKPKEKQTYIAREPSIERIQLPAFPKGNLFTRLHPDYQSFKDLEDNLNN